MSDGWSARVTADPSSATESVSAQATRRALNHAP
jgi:hypothetical protein